MRKISENGGGCGGLKRRDKVYKALHDATN